MRVTKHSTCSDYRSPELGSFVDCWGPLKYRWSKFRPFVQRWRRQLASPPCCNSAAPVWPIWNRPGQSAVVHGGQMVVKWWWNGGSWGCTIWHLCDNLEAICSSTWLPISDICWFPEIGLHLNHILIFFNGNFPYKPTVLDTSISGNLHLILSFEQRIWIATENLIAITSNSSLPLASPCNALATKNFHQCPCLTKQSPEVGQIPCPKLGEPETYIGSRSHLD